MAQNAEEVQFEREVGSGGALPFGAAADLNARAAAVPSQEELPVPQPDPVGGTGLPDNVEYADSEPDPDIKPADEVEEVLFGPAQGHGRGMPDMPSAHGPVPASVVRRLPALARAAARPDAPDSLRALYKTLLNRLEREMRDV